MNDHQKAEIAAYKRKIDQAVQNKQGPRRTGRKFRWSSMLRMSVVVPGSEKHINCSQEIEKYAGRIKKLEGWG